MVLLLQTPALLQTVSHYAVHYDVPEELHAALAPSDRNLDQNESKLSIQRTLSHELLVQLVQWSKAHPITQAPASTSTSTYRYPPTLAYLLSLTQVYAPPLAAREKSPALLEILASLQLASDTRSYALLTSLTPLSSSTTPSLALTSISRLPLRDDFARGVTSHGGEMAAGEDWGQVGKELTAIANVGVSMVAMAFAVWWVGGGRSVGMVSALAAHPVGIGRTEEVIERLALSLIAAVLIGSAETFLYYRHFTREASALGERDKMKVTKEARLRREAIAKAKPTSGDAIKMR